MKESGKSSRMRIGWVVFVVLAVLTLIEYWLGVAVSSSTPYLTATAAVKGGLIVLYFMHISQLWKKEKSHQ